MLDIGFAIQKQLQASGFGVSRSPASCTLGRKPVALTRKHKHMRSASEATIFFPGCHLSDIGSRYRMKVRGR